MPYGKGQPKFFGESIGTIWLASLTTLCQTTKYKNGAKKISKNLSNLQRTQDFIQGSFKPYG